MTQENLSISLEKIAGLAVEHWRLRAALAPILEQSSSAALRHSLRKIEDFLRSCEIETRGMDGLPYDAGLAARVLENVPDPSLPKGASLIAETVSPLVLYRGAVLRPADIVVATHA